MASTAIQLALLSGIYGRPTPDLVRSYPINCVPVVEDSGLSKGYLRLAPGVRTMAAISGDDRGGIDWLGVHYRVIGTDLCTVSPSGALTVIGGVGAGGRAQFAYSFDRLAVASGGRLYYLFNGTLSQVTDPDLGVVLSLTWFDGYFVTTDGTSIVVTQLADPTQVDPQKYGSSEADPDPVVGVIPLRGEVYVFNRNTTEVFIDTGSTGFPFSRQRGAQLPKGAVGPDAFSLFVETIAFVGSGRNEAPAVYLAGSGTAIRISPRALDDDLAALSLADLAQVHVEAINGAGLVELRIHLPGITWCYDWTASQQLDSPTWHRLAGGAAVDQAYPARGLTFTGGQWWLGTDGKLGVVDPSIVTVFDGQTGYRFDTTFVYNEGASVIIHSLELLGMFGQGAGSVWLSHSDDGVTWGQEKAASVGALGRRDVRPSWRRLGRIRNWRSFRFRGVAKAPVSFARLEAMVEPLG